VWIAWHIGGMSWSEFLDLPCSQRHAITDALADRIDEDNERAAVAARGA
jgi:hypothetical protein